MVNRAETAWHPREEIERMIAGGELDGLLKRAAQMHGHYCTFLALGVKAGALAVRELRAASKGMEEVVAIVETNNCFSDGVQFTTGCSFGNNALIYLDYGKTAFTLAKREGKGIRVCVEKTGREITGERFPRLRELFDRVLKERSSTPEEREERMILSCQAAFEMLKVPEEELFKVQWVEPRIPPYARVFESIRCTQCGENIMETRARMKDGRVVCIPCSGLGAPILDGSGITFSPD